MVFGVAVMTFCQVHLEARPCVHPSCTGTAVCRARPTAVSFAFGRCQPGTRRARGIGACVECISLPPRPTGRAGPGPGPTYLYQPTLCLTASAPAYLPASQPTSTCCSFFLSCCHVATVSVSQNQSVSQSRSNWRGGNISLPSLYPPLTGTSPSSPASRHYCA